MATLRGKIKNILGLVSIGVLFTAGALGMLAKENNVKVSSSQLPNQSYLGADHFSAVIPGGEEIMQPTLVCSEVLEKDENAFIFAEYSNVAAVDCMSVGCGGIF
jgi:hypothetical protein